MGKGKPQPEAKKQNQSLITPGLACEAPRQRKPDNGSRKTQRRNPGRGDGKTWNGRSFICAPQVDDYAADVDPDMGEGEWERECYCDADADAGVVQTRTRVRYQVLLSDIARLAKPKGVRKEFEMVAMPQRIIEVEDEFELEDEDEEWEKVGYEFENGVRSTPSYAAILSYTPG